MKILNILNFPSYKKMELRNLIADLSDQVVVWHEFIAKADISVLVEASCLNIKVNSKVELAYTSKSFNLDFEFSFLLPPRKVYNPLEVAKRLNNLTNVLVREFKFNSRKSQLPELNEDQQMIIKTFAQRVLSKYMMSNESVYQHALEALCYGKYFHFNNVATLHIKRYAATSKEWRLFRYQRCPRIFSSSAAELNYVPFGA